MMDADAFAKVDTAYLYFDKSLIRRTKNLRLVPNFHDRRGGKISYGEWCHVIGIFQSLIYTQLSHERGHSILDIGCGTGILAIAAEPFLGKNGRFTGIDTNRDDITFCQRHYPSPPYSFQHLPVFNATYAKHQTPGQQAWDVESNSIDLVTALSVWTHLNETDARFYFNEIKRVLRPKGKAIVTFFILDDHYYQRLAARKDQPGTYHNTSQLQWIFNIAMSPSTMWFHPRWAKQPEDAVAITRPGIDQLCRESTLQEICYFPGNWKEIPGMYFQDIVIFENRF